MGAAVHIGVGMEKGDLEAVRDVLHRYCRLLDGGAIDDLLTGVYTPDAVDDRQRGDPLRGHDAIRPYLAAALELCQATAHLLANVEIDIAGDEAASSSRVMASHWFVGTAMLGVHRPADCVLVATYDDHLTRGPDGWRIDHRRVSALGPGGLLFGSMPTAFNGFAGITA
jgi:hypothetical protein